MSSAPEPNAPLGGNTKVTRDDWLGVAMEVLICEGVSQVKIQPLGAALDVSRSSFYWYFKSRQDLLDALLEAWDTKNTGAILRHAAMPSDTVTRSVLNLFRAFAITDIFNPRLDFAVREWARRSDDVRQIVDRADDARLGAIRAMYERHGYPAEDALIRARIIYYMQLGYYALELQESMDQRLAASAIYVEQFTGKRPSPAELDDFYAFIRQTTQGQQITQGE